MEVMGEREVRRVKGDPGGEGCGGEGWRGRVGIFVGW